MGLFFGSSSGLSMQDVDRVLSSMGILESSDRKRAKQLLKGRRSGGISKRDVKLVVRKLKRERDDDVSRSEASAIRRELLEELDE